MINLYQIYDRIFSNKVEDKIIDIIHNNTNNKLVIFDIGCYEGNFSKRIHAYLKKEIDFYLFDPIPTTRNKFKNITFDFKFFNFAFDQSEGIKDFFFNTGFVASGSSLLPVMKNSISYNLSRRFFLLNPKKLFSTIKVETKTIDNFVKENQIKMIDVLKLDTEGSELNILNGAKNTLDNTKIVYTEILSEKNNFKKKLDQINQIMFNKNFELIYDKKIFLTSFLTNLAAHDLIYVKKK